MYRGVLGGKASIPPTVAVAAACELSASGSEWRRPHQKLAARSLRGVCRSVLDCIRKARFSAGSPVELSSAPAVARQVRWAALAKCFVRLSSGRRACVSGGGPLGIAIAVMCMTYRGACYARERSCAAFAQWLQVHVSATMRAKSYHLPTTVVDVSAPQNRAFTAVRHGGAQVNPQMQRML